MRLTLIEGIFHEGTNLAIYPQYWYGGLREGQVVDLVNIMGEFLGKGMITKQTAEDFGHITDEETLLYHKRNMNIGEISSSLYTYYGDTFLYSVRVVLIFFEPLEM